MTDHVQPLTGGPGAKAGGAVSGALKAGTAEDHHRTEKGDFQRRFASGRLSLELYVAWLEQMLHVYRVLEARLASLRTDERFSGFLDEELWRTPQLERDLRHFGRPAGQAPALPATEALGRRFEEWAGRPALVGGLYVLEGSTNGSRFNARVLRKAYRLADGDGTAFLDPYGERQPEKWRAFKAALDTLPEADVPALVTAARATFVAIQEIGAELLERAGGQEPA